MPATEGIVLMTSRPNRAIAAAAVATLTATTAIATLAAPAQAKAKAPVWTRLSAGSGVGISSQPRVVRWHGKLIVVWPQDTDSAHTSIRSRILAPTAKPVGGVSDVVTSWSSVTSDPDVLLLGGVPTVAFGGLRTNDSTDPYTGPMAYAQAADATSWALGPGSLTQSHSAYGDYGFGVVDNGAGQPVSAGAYSSSDHVTIHYGIDPSVPAAAPDLQTAGTVEAQDVDVARDSKTGAIYALWYSGASAPTQQGVHSAQIWPAVGPPSAPAPLSTVNFGGGKASVNPSQNVAVAGRVGGGVWAAYSSGYPSPTKLVLWNVETGRTLTLRTSGAIQYTGISAAPGGRMWVWWIQGSTLYATRTNPSVTKFGIVRSVASPAAPGESPTRTSGDGALGPLDAVINVVGKVKDASGNYLAEIDSTRILEGLRVAVSPAKVSYAKGGTVVVSVTDAGVPVPGVSVKIGSVVEHTNAKGRVSFTVAKHSAKGVHAVTASAAGWWPGKSSFKVG
ncbi:MAG: hypothetical protein QOJ11_2295 [Frankiales bacterium]|nr:hypothetical protein [Frankiales bacterium]